MNIDDEIKIGVIGLGYVGLPLAIEFAKKYKVLGFDLNAKRIEELKLGRDSTNEVDGVSLEESTIELSDDESDLSQCNVFIVTVPTPIDSEKKSKPYTCH